MSRYCAHIKLADTSRRIRHCAMDAARGWPGEPRPVLVGQEIRMSTKQICRVIYIKLPTGRLISELLSSSDKIYLVKGL